MIKLVIETTYINIESICHFECKLIISAYCPKCPVLSISRFRKTQLGFFFLFWLKWHQSDTSFESRLYLTVKLGIPQVTANNYKTHLYFLQNIQSNTTVVLIIHTFFKICVLEIVFVSISRMANNFRFTPLENAWTTVVLLWKKWRKYESVSYLFCWYSCGNITMTVIQISNLFYFDFFSKTNHQMMI